MFYLAGKINNCKSKLSSEECLSGFRVTLNNIFNIFNYRSQQILCNVLCFQLHVSMCVCVYVHVDLFLGLPTEPVINHLAGAPVCPCRAGHFLQVTVQQWLPQPMARDRQVQQCQDQRAGPLSSTANANNLAVAAPELYIVFSMINPAFNIAWLHNQYRVMISVRQFLGTKCRTMKVCSKGFMIQTGRQSSVIHQHTVISRIIQ